MHSNYCLKKDMPPATKNLATEKDTECEHNSGLFTVLPPVRVHTCSLPVYYQSHQKVHPVNASARRDCTSRLPSKDV